MDQRYHTFSFGHYHQAPGASCSILYVLVLSLVLLYNPYIPFLIYEIFHLLVYSINSRGLFLHSTKQMTILMELASLCLKKLLLLYHV